MSAPSTLSKADDPIERVKQSLATQWGLKFPSRNPVASPSKRNLRAIDEKIHSYIRYLYYNKTPLEGSTPLEFAIARFEHDAPTIISKWQFKPQAETGLLPTRPQMNSPLMGDFLHHRNELDPALLRDLMLRLEHVLGDVAQKIRSRQSFHQLDSGGSAKPAVKTSPELEFNSGQQFGTHPSSEYDFDEGDDIFRTHVTEVSRNESETFITPPTSPSRRRQLGPSNEADEGEPSHGESPRPSKLRRGTLRNEIDAAQPRPKTSQRTELPVEQKPATSFISSVTSSMTSVFTAMATPISSSSTVANEEDPMDFDWEAMSISDYMPAPASQVPPSQDPTSRPNFAAKLRSGNPFKMHDLVTQTAVPFRQMYEVERVSRAANVDINLFSGCLTKREDDYLILWRSICDILKTRNIDPPEPSPNIAWDKAQEDFSGVSLTARLQFLQTAQESYFELQFMPLKLEPTYRLSRHFHGDRFIVLSIPGFEPRDLPPYLKGDAETFRTAFIDWLLKTKHEILGRIWSPFYVKPEESKKKQSRVHASNDTRFRVYLFAEDGQDFGSIDQHIKTIGETDWRSSRILDRPRLTVREMVEWFMCFEENQSQYALKFFARLSLGLSTTVKTRLFKPQQIIRSDDAFADLPCERRLDVSRSDSKKTRRGLTQNESAVMNDGCARISKHAAFHIAMDLELDYIPSAFQGRIGGAKGVWMVDALQEVLPLEDEDDQLWIEVTDSQLKVQAATLDSFCPDPDRVTFEANSWSRPLSSNYLNYQLLPILHDRGVPREVFRRLLEHDLQSKTADLDSAIEDGLSLRKWCQSNYPTTTDRLKNGGIEMLGGIPDVRSERINWFIDHGFEAKTCAALRKLVFELIRDQCMKLQSRMNIGLESSTNALMIADPLNILEADEVHVAFSGTFKDPQGFDLSMLHGIDILVARLPALLPSDIQKVRAVFRPELRIYRDVIVFSARGDASLASKLSGGDYDGDKAWICWEPSIVEPFQNASVPEQPSPNFYGIEKDLTKVSDFMQHSDFVDRFLKHAFEFYLQPKMLGIITKYHEKYCYAVNTIDSQEAIALAHLLGLLVDSSKAGFKFTDSQWTEYRKKHNIPKSLPELAYRDIDSPRFKADNLIDDLIFNTAKPVCEAVLTSIYRKFPDAKTFDEDLVRLSRLETREAENDPSIATVLELFRRAFDEIVSYYITQCSRFKEDSNINYNFAPRTATSNKPKLRTPGYRALIEKIRADFLAIAPCPNDEAALAVVSPTVRRWAEEYYSSSCSSSTSAKAGSDYWSLLKASLAFSRHHSSSCIWYACGAELGELKATMMGRGSYRTVVGGVFDALKVDGRLADAFVRRRMEGDGRPIFVGEQGSLEGGGEEDYGDGLEFGGWGWEDGG